MGKRVTKINYSFVVQSKKEASLADVESNTVNFMASGSIRF